MCLCVWFLTWISILSTPTTQWYCHCSVRHIAQWQLHQLAYPVQWPNADLGSQKRNGGICWSQFSTLFEHWYSICWLEEEEGREKEEIKKGWLDNVVMGSTQYISVKHTEQWYEVKNNHMGKKLATLFSPAQTDTHVCIWTHTHFPHSEEIHQRTSAVCALHKKLLTCW